jgi:hypothetical protein
VTERLPFSMREPAPPECRHLLPRFRVRAMGGELYRGERVKSDRERDEE